MSYKLSLVSIGQVRPNPQWAMPSHSHDFHELIAIVGGRMTIRMPGRQFEARPGTVMFYPAGIWHEETSDSRRPVHTFFISFHCAGIDSRMPWTAQDAERKIGRLFEWLFAERHGNWVQIDAWRSALAETAFLHYLRLVSYREADLVERARTFMRSQLGKPVALEDVATAVGLTRFHFAREYRKLSGRTPMDDYRRIKAEAARDLLLDSDLHPKKIAAEVGFANHPHLSRLMKQYLGTTPSDFKRRVRRPAQPVKIEDHG
jgi:AraC-like DNA-binding protein